LNKILDLATDLAELDLTHRQVTAMTRVWTLENWITVYNKGNTDTQRNRQTDAHREGDKEISRLSYRSSTCVLPPDVSWTMLRDRDADATKLLNIELIQFEMPCASSSYSKHTNIS